ncbi:MAG: response regulator transcription factor [Thermoanaerobaculia bacterium]
MKLLLIEDSLRLQRSLKLGLSRAGFTVDLASTGTEGLWFASECDYDVVILDWMLPEVDGMGVLERLRMSGSSAPVLMLSAKDRVEDRVQGLNAGADDYLTKPFSFSELEARILALARRARVAATDLIAAGDVVLDRARRVVTVGGRELPLTAKELGLLELLLQRRGALVSHAEIRDHIYELARDPASNVVEVLVYKLRRKLRAAGVLGLIVTRRDLGYLVPEGSP